MFWNFFSSEKHYKLKNNKIILSTKPINVHLNKLVVDQFVTILYNPFLYENRNWMGSNIAKFNVYGDLFILSCLPIQVLQWHLQTFSEYPSLSFDPRLVRKEVQ